MSSSPLRALVAGVAVVLLCSAQAALGQTLDWGGTFDSATALDNTETQSDPWLEQTVRVALWSEVFQQFRAERELLVTAEAEYRFEYDEDPDEDPLHLLDLQTLRLRLIAPVTRLRNTTVVTNAGRFRFREPTGAILSHTGDGFTADALAPSLRLRVGGAYTGWVLNPVSTVRMTGSDAEEDSEDGQQFGPKRAIGLLEIEATEIYGRQSITFLTLGQLDLRDAELGQDTLNSQYLAILLDGPIEPIRGLYYQAFAVKGFGQYELVGDGTNELSFGAYGARMRYFLERLRFSRLLVEWLHASGGDRFDRFAPITSPTLGFAYRPDFANVMTARAEYSLRPFSTARNSVASSAQVATGGRVYLRSATTERIVSDIAIDQDRTDRYLGSEAVVRFAMRPSPELGLGFKNALFFPNSDLFDGGDPVYRGLIELSLGF